MTEDEQYMQSEEDDLKTGKVNAVNLQCPYCGAKQSINSKLKEVMCTKCTKEYKVPEKVRELL